MRRSTHSLHIPICLDLYGCICRSIRASYNTASAKSVSVKDRVSAADDGYQQIAFEYVWRTGGIASEDDYPYIGVSSYCNSSKPLTKLQKAGLHPGPMCNDTPKFCC